MGEAKGRGRNAVMVLLLVVVEGRRVVTEGLFWMGFSLIRLRPQSSRSRSQEPGCSGSGASVPAVMVARAVVATAVPPPLPLAPPAAPAVAAAAR
jgi:hypothetical protein